MNRPEKIHINPIYFIVFSLFYFDYSINNGQNQLWENRRGKKR